MQAMAPTTSTATFGNAEHSIQAHTINGSVEFHVPPGTVAITIGFRFLASALFSPHGPRDRGLSTSVLVRCRGGSVIYLIVKCNVWSRSNDS
jgi:hypothetical protein